MKDREAPKIGSIIVNYETENKTRKLADQLQSVCLEIVIVDNSSPSESLADWCKMHDRVTYLTSDGNIGYAAGNNLGIEHLTQKIDCYFVINPDTDLPSADVVTQLAEQLLSNPEIGILAPAVGDGSTANQHQGQAAVRLLQELELIPKTDERDDNIIPRTQVLGCAMMLSAAMVEDIGFLDSSFFLYVEEIEYCYRARENGYQVAFDPDTTVYHDDEGQGFSHPSPYQTYYRTRNIFLLARRRFSGTAKIAHLSSVGIILYAIIKNREWKLIKPWFGGIVDGMNKKEGKYRYLVD